MEHTYGWDYPGNVIADNYIRTIKSFISNDQEFNNFRQKLGSTGILEGDASCGDLWLNMILSKYGDSVLKEKLELFKRNDIYGNPIIKNYGEYGDVCPFTFLYILQGLNAVNKFNNAKFNKIAEIGSGYGALCIIMDSLCEFKEYVIIDLPEVVELNRQYLINFPEIYKKVTFVPCNNLNEITDVDLCVSIAAISECDTATQLNYFDKIIKHSKHSYLGYNRVNYDFLNVANDKFNIETENSGIIEFYLTKK